MGVAALGVVFGDIGTSPLYTLKTVLALTGAQPSPEIVLGVLSLLLWTLVIITSVKYVTFAMSIDNDGEGGILALMALLGMKTHKRPILVAIGLFGAALIYGDGAITPAISVLSALEGLDIIAPDSRTYVLPAAVVILFALFALQPLGTAWIGKAFGPIMLLWFAIMALLGLRGLVQHPAVVAAVNPLYAIRYLSSNGLTSFLVMGGVFLCVTGAEALYADMGHFGARPIRVAWSAIVFPSLVLNYAGQCAIVLNGASSEHNIFYQLCPRPLVAPFIVLATIATIIASQSIITGAFSMTRQAIRLGWLPRLRITQTSAEGYGQIYVPVVNWLLMAATVSLTLLFKKSDNLASAYGIAVSATMLMTSGLLFIAMREIWNWSLVASLAVAGVFICIDTAFFLANSVKIAEGGYVPLLLASGIYAIMTIWHRGSEAVARQMHEGALCIDVFLASLKAQNIPRVPGAGIFLTHTTNDVPPVMIWHVKHNEALHRHLLVLTVKTLSKPWVVDDAERLAIEKLAPDFWRATASFGFMERPDIPRLLAVARDKGCGLPRDNVTYYIGGETIVAREDGKGHPKWETTVFAALERNSCHAGEFLHLPNDGLVAIGRQVAI
jgi:KUP system potassium uptake protein